jgi:hypothetical protein
VISQKGLNDLVEDYRHALDYVNQAAFALENASVLISAAGTSFARDSVRVIDQTNTLYVEINKVMSRLREVTPDA